MSWKTSFIILGATILLAAGIWFGWERAVLYWQIHAPLPKEWVAVYLDNGEIFYGHLNGVGRETVKLSDVYFLDKFIKKDNGGTAAENVNSPSFSVGGKVDDSPKYVLVQKENDLFFNRAAVLYWEAVAPGLEVYKYLR